MWDTFGVCWRMIYCFIHTVRTRGWTEWKLSTVCVRVLFNPRAAFPRLAQLTSTQIVLHCTTSQVSNCLTVSITGLFGKHLYSRTLAKRLQDQCDRVSTTRLLGHSMYTAIPTVHINHPSVCQALTSRGKGTSNIDLICKQTQVISLTCLTFTDRQVANIWTSAPFQRRGKQVRSQRGAMHPLGICKISNTNTLISLLKACTSTCCLCWTGVVENGHFEKMYVQQVLCSVIERINVWRRGQVHTEF